MVQVAHNNLPSLLRQLMTRFNLSCIPSVCQSLLKLFTTKNCFKAKIREPCTAVDAGFLEGGVLLYY